MSDIIVKTTGLCADFKIKDRMVRAVNRVSLSLERGKTLVILGVPFYCSAPFQAPA